LSDYTWVRDSGYFDAPWYLARYADVAGTGLDPIQHYLQIGASEGRDPGPRFSTRRYLARHPDLVGTTRNPLLDLLEDRRWRALVEGAERPGEPEPDYATDEYVVRQSSLFDADWYRATYPDIRGASVDPVRHYIEFGAAECRDPGPRFSTRDHLARHPELADSGENPLAHAVRTSSEVGRNGDGVVSAQGLEPWTR
jgi:hypothetical protein